MIFPKSVAFIMAAVACLASAVPKDREELRRLREEAIANDKAFEEDEVKRVQADPSGLIFSIPIDKVGTTFVVECGSHVDPMLPKAAGRPDTSGLTRRFYNVRAELRSPTTSPVVLSSRLRGQSGSNNDSGSVVLTHLVEPGRMVLLMAEGPGLYLWQISVVQGVTCWTPLWADKQWQKGSLSFRIDQNNLGAKLTRLDDGRLSVEIFERSFKSHSQLDETSNGSFRFNLVRQWED